MVPEYMHFLVAGFDGKNIAAQFHVTPHFFIVDVIGEALRNLCCFLGKFFRIIRHRPVTTAIIVFYGLPGFVDVAAEMAQQFARDAGI